MSTDDNRALTQRFYEEVWNKGNLDAVAELLSSASSMRRGLFAVFSSTIARFS